MAERLKGPASYFPSIEKKYGHANAIVAVFRKDNGL